MLKKTKLIVRSNPDDLRKIKEEIIEGETKKRQLIKWSDMAIETKTKLIIFKVISIPRDIVDKIKGYDLVDADELIESLDDFVKEIRLICTRKELNIPNMPQKAPQSSRTNIVSKTTNTSTNKK